MPNMNFQVLPTGSFKLTALLDHHDFRDISEAMIKRMQMGTMPDAAHDDATYTGRVLAEICRGWMEMRDAGQGGE